MICAVAFAMGLALARDVDADFSIDLYLVANNKTVLQNLDWLDRPQQGETVEALLRPELKALDARKESYVVIDGADCSIFPTTSNERDVRYIARNYSGYDSMTETIQKKGVTKTRVLERTETTVTESGGLFARPAGKKGGYISQFFLYFGNFDKTRFAVVQDLNSYHTTCTTGQAQDKEHLRQTLLLSGDSIQESKAFLRDHHYDFQGICIAKWGLTDPTAPNYIAFPAAGAVGHYILSRESGKWAVRLVGYLRA